MPDFEIRLRGGEKKIVNGERVDIQEALTENGFRSVVVMRGAVIMARFRAEEVEGWDRVEEPGS